jgi:hypothetical protein
LAKIHYFTPLLAKNIVIALVVCAKSAHTTLIPPLAGDDCELQPSRQQPQQTTAAAEQHHRQANLGYLDPG